MHKQECVMEAAIAANSAQHMVSMEACTQNVSRAQDITLAFKYLQVRTQEESAREKLGLFVATSKEQIAIQKGKLSRQPQLPAQHVILNTEIAIKNPKMITQRAQFGRVPATLQCPTTQLRRMYTPVQRSRSQGLQIVARGTSTASGPRFIQHKDEAKTFYRFLSIV
eukprot:1144055-Pelagomonas_calceolata.AAC.1